MNDSGPMKHLPMDNMKILSDRVKRKNVYDCWGGRRQTEETEDSPKW